MLNKKIVKDNFSKYAGSYDQYCDVQNYCAAKLISSIEQDGFENILDLGCGTGNYTELLSNKNPQANIKAVDISKQMIDVARSKIQDDKVRFFVDDAEYIDFKEKFDLISSNASFQWFGNLKKSLLRYKRLLRSNGIIAFSIFGPETYHELGSTLKESLFGYTNIITDDFTVKKDIRQMLKMFFRRTHMTEEIYKKQYSSLTELLQSIKYTGTRGNGANRNLWTQAKIRLLEKAYREKFGKIIATYQIFYCRGIK